MSYVTEEQIRAAKGVDLLTYLQVNEPWELKKTSANEYRTDSHGSLVISSGLWYWNRGKVGGRSALDFLIKVRGIGFVKAVEMVIGNHTVPVFSALPVEKAKPPPNKTLVMPTATKFPARVTAYLQERGIHPDVIRRCLCDGSLYESSYQDKAVCVFVGRDDKGTAKFAHMRGVDTDLKRDVYGSDIVEAI
ncbi:hypothetical protein AGMMS49975_25360 [Clostridia bacterium]|nr:hypothetical protein AGMMS49975_25360 [Clostridia bacterium]